jgi:hypothetical protein
VVVVDPGGSFLAFLGFGESYRFSFLILFGELSSYKLSEFTVVGFKLHGNKVAFSFVMSALA